MRSRSPLRIPEQRGPVFRYFMSIVFLGLCLLMVYVVIDGLVHGLIMLKLGRMTPVHYISRANHPKMFWFAVVFNTTVTILVGYLAISEIIYTKKREKELNTRAQTSAVGSQQ